MRRIVVISGPPGAGKTSLAMPLAARLRMPLLTKDAFKETLYDTLGDTGEDPMVRSRRLGGAAMELLWRIAEDCPASILEANFRTSSDYERDRLTRLTDRPVEVFCRVPTAVVARRFEERAGRPKRHPAHGAASSMPAEWFEQFQSPFGLGSVIEVDTTREVDVDDVAGEVTRLLS